ncbi:phage minor head protein [Xenorhabdus eapokensis]|uniref:Head morphogenesis protein n=1 Tax=Xenorhabdus eapokensis TaxID=1873482 RepID=A0A1Q5TQX2_9GAMM|nr:phage minor head protein [Xenorhabdus eapokensis]OKP02601.1 head morphogenesis protein [Xenorhabdus eapokensis]
MDALDSYSELITPWAQRVAQRFALDVNRHNENEWRQRSQLISLELRHLVNNTPVGHVMRSIVDEQIKYIKSLPIEAADRVYDIHNRAIEAVVTGGRHEPFAQEIAKTGEVALSRAKLIARTEIGSAQTALTQSRAQSIGSTGYIWRTADGDARDSHHKMEGQFVEWAKPPTLDGLTGHAGTLPNCRCYCEVVIPEC